MVDNIYARVDFDKLSPIEIGDVVFEQGFKVVVEVTDQHIVLANCDREAEPIPDNYTTVVVEDGVVNLVVTSKPERQKFWLCTERDSYGLLRQTWIQAGKRPDKPEQCNPECVLIPGMSSVCRYNAQESKWRCVPFPFCFDNYQVVGEFVFRFQAEAAKSLLWEKEQEPKETRVRCKCIRCAGAYRGGK